MKIKHLIWSLIIIFILSILATFLFSSFFNLKSLEFKVDDISQDNAKALMEKANLHYGENLTLKLLKEGDILRGRFVRAEQYIKEDKQLKDVNVVRKDKNSILVSYNLRKPQIALAFFDYYLYADYDGTIFMSERNLLEKAYLIKGIEIDSFYYGMDLSTCNYMFSQLSSFCENIEKYDLQNFTATRILIQDILLEDGKIRVYYNKNLEVILNIDDNLDYNAYVMCEILSLIGSEERGYLDFTSSENPYFTPF